MSGEIILLCKIVKQLKKCYNDKKFYELNIEDYIDAITFETIEGNVYDFKGYFGYLSNNNLVDIKLLLNTNTELNTVGFANVRNDGIVLFFNDRVEYIISNWTFNADKKKWEIKFKSFDWSYPHKQLPIFENNTSKLKEVLKEICDLATDLEFEYFANIFLNSINILDGENIIENKYKLNFDDKEKETIFLAATTSYVFGAMGSWNDSPRFVASERNMTKKYDELSSRLHLEICNAILYAINE